MHATRMKLRGVSLALMLAVLAACRLVSAMESGHAQPNATPGVFLIAQTYARHARLFQPDPAHGAGAADRLEHVATATRKAGHDVRFVDLMMSRESLAGLRAALKEYQPEITGFSVRNIDNVIAQRASWHLDEVRDMVATVRVPHRRESRSPSRAR